MVSEDMESEKNRGVRRGEKSVAKKYPQKVPYNASQLGF